jgi:hypothetical protein
MTSKLSWPRFLTVLLVAITVLAGLSSAAVPALAGSPKVSAATNANLSLAGKWLSETNGAVYDFEQTGASTYSGYVVDGGCASAPGDIMDTAHGGGYYTGTENTFSTSSPCTVSGTATNTIQVSSDGGTAVWNSSGCSDCGAQTWTREGASSSCQEVTDPAHWDTAEVPSPSPGIKTYVEPLNVIISGCSDVPLDDIEDAMSNWFTTSSQIVDVQHLAYKCISPEQADVTGGGYVVQDQAWRLGGCIGGGFFLALTGAENHVRIWNQPIAGTIDGAWFVTASYETDCVVDQGRLVPYASLHGFFFGHNLFHCVDGGAGSYGTNGYGRGAYNFVQDIAAAARDKDWRFSYQTITRPLGGVDTGEAGAKFGGTVYVVTVTS